MLKIHEIKPLFNQVVTTMKFYGDNVKVGNLIDATKINRVKEYQTVIAVGPLVQEKGNIKPGDVVIINPKRYGSMNHRFGLKNADNVEKDNMCMTFDIPHFTVYDANHKKGRDVLLIGDNDIQCVVVGEEVPDDIPTEVPVLHRTKNKLILPDKKVII